LKQQVEETRFDEQQLLATARRLTEKCAEFEVYGQVLQIHPGPVVTTFEFKPDPGGKYSRITNLADDLCLALKATSIRIDRVPGKNTVGIEVPNLERRTIYLREALNSSTFQGSSSKLTLGLGHLINGRPFVTDLAKMPHLLIAGATGSGKSVGLNCMVCSILFKADPQDVRFILVDPKRLELGLYEDIPHLLTPIVKDPKKAANALNWAVREMERRYKALAQEGVRNIDQFNQVVDENQGHDEEELERLPYIVIIVDELADLMMSAGKEVEIAVTRLAQMARAVGIHLILATQRPSVDVLTGLIKANFPCRISYRVSSKVDSRTILDANGAETLLGNGDMLYLSPETARPIRIHGGFISEKEIAGITKFLKKQAAPHYQEEVLVGEENVVDEGLIDVSEMEDKLYDEAARFVVEVRRASTSLLQRRFRIGYGRAARLLDMMEHEGVVGPSEGSRPREILVPPELLLLLTTSVVSKESDLPPRFTVGVDTVLVRVTVTDPLNRYVVGLDREHFRVFENKVEQAISHFSNDKSPISVGVILDTSGSMGDNILSARTSVMRFLDQGDSRDEYFLLGFSDRSKLIQDFTSSGENIQNQVSIATPKGRTALYDAIYLGLEKMSGGKNEKKALIVITDGEDNTSRYTFREVKDFVKESETQIYVIGERGELGYGRGIINEIVRLTGGRAFFPHNFKQLDYFVDLIHTELRNQYVLGYIPHSKDFDGKWRKLKIRLNPPEGLPKLNVRAREGYFAPKK
jgi:VWFA-related protein